MGSAWTPESPSELIRATGIIVPGVGHFESTAAIGQDWRAAIVEATTAPTLLAGDLGCLMNMAGKLARDGSPVEVRHVTEVLAGMADGPAIGKTK